MQTIGPRILALAVSLSALVFPAAGAELRVLSFNILTGGSNAPSVGFDDRGFGGSRKDDLARVILGTQADVVGVQEDDGSDGLLRELGADWHRLGSVYSRCDLSPAPGGVRVHLSRERSVVVVNAHWWPTGGYGPFLVRDRLRQNNIPDDPAEFEQQILRATAKIADGARGYRHTINGVKPLLDSGETVVVTGDFNEPPHLDWTERAAKKGFDRWVGNPTGRPLRFKVAWAGSVALEHAGLKDAYRVHFPDEVAKPGNTWTPPYKTGVGGRCPWEDQVLDRIDRIHFGGPGIRVIDAAVVGEDRNTCEIVASGPWPSDHRAVLAVFEIEDAEEP